MTKGEQTREHILAKTAPIFNRKGFDGTTLSDLEKATGLTKGSLYGNFSSKDDLASQAFRYSMSKVKALVRSEVGEALTCKGQLLALINFYSKYVFDPPVAGGCPLLNSAVEADDYRTSMRKVVVEELQATIAFIESLIRKGITAGEFRKNIKPHAMAYIFFCSVEGALMFSRAERSTEAMDIIAKHCEQMLDDISL